MGPFDSATKRARSDFIGHSDDRTQYGARVHILYGDDTFAACTCTTTTTFYIIYIRTVSRPLLTARAAFSSLAFINK